MKKTFDAVFRGLHPHASHGVVLTVVTKDLLVKEHEVTRTTLQGLDPSRKGNYMYHENGFNLGLEMRFFYPGASQSPSF